MFARKRLIRDQRHRLRRDHGDGGEIAKRVVRQLLADRRIDQKRIRGDQIGVAVLRRVRDRGGGEDGAGAGPVLDHDGLAAPACRQHLGEDARDHVGRATGRERHHELHRPRRKIGLRLRSRR